MARSDYISEIKTAVEARFELRDTVLKKELDDLATRVARIKASGEEEAVGVKLRLICEADLKDRAQMAWAAIRKIHSEEVGSATPNISGELLGELESYMRQATLSLAGHLRSRATTFAGEFSGAGAINADWMARQRQNAIDSQRKSIDEYVTGLRKGVRRLLS